MEKELKNLLAYNLQFFAEDGGAESDNSDNGASEDANGGQEDQNSKESGERTFTQTQVSAMMTKEKNEGKRSVLKSLGFKDEAEAKSAFAAYKAFVDSQKSEQEKNADDVKNANAERDESIARAIAAENKLTCFEAGVGKDSIDDVLAIASTKVNDSKDLEQVLKEMKKDNRYSGFFNTNTQNGSGTGRNPNHSNSVKDKNEFGDLGKRLAGNNQSSEKKSSFFS